MQNKNPLADDDGDGDDEQQQDDSDSFDENEWNLFSPFYALPNGGTPN